MEFSAHAATFAKRVGIAADAASRNEHRLAGMTLEADKSAGKVTLRCAAEDRAAIVECPAEVETAGSVILPAHLLAQVATEAARDAVTINISSLDGEEGQCKIADSSRGIWSLHCLDPDEHDGGLAPERGAKGTAKLTHAQMREVQDVITPCAAKEKDTARPILTGVQCTIRKDKSIRWVATDSYRLARVESDPSSTAEIKAEALIPPAALLSAAKHAPESATIDLTVFKRQVSLRFELDDQCSARLFVALLAGDYPTGWEQVLQAKRPGLVKVDPVHLSRAISRSSLLSEDSKTGPVDLDVKSETITVHAIDDDGEAHHVVSCEANAQAADRKTKFRIPYLQQALGSCPKPSISLQCGAAPKATEVDDEGKPVDRPWCADFELMSGWQATVMVMPLRVT